MKAIPDELDLMTMRDGSAVVSVEDFEKRKKEIIDLLSEYAYGYMPGVFGKTTWDLGRTDGEEMLGGKGRLYDVNVNADTGNGIFTFPIKRIVNARRDKAPVIILINFRRDVYDKYCPTEEILDEGFNLVQVCYEDITSDDCSFGNGLAAYYDRGQPSSPGKISMWAWAVSRIIDILPDFPEYETDEIAVVGHSRLGKTTLWCAAHDERVKYACDCMSGCMGSACEYDKHPGGETRQIISRNFPYWFCPRFNESCAEGAALPFDQHMLLSLIAPRYLAVASALDDLWADPASQRATCDAASAAWKLYGKTGLICPDEPAEEGKDYISGDIAYHVRAGTHFLSRDEWRLFMNFIKDKKKS